MISADVVVALHRVTWQALESGPGNWAAARLVRALAASPRVERLLVADPMRSAAVLLRRAPQPHAGPHVHHVRPLRVRRHDPVDAAAVERAYGRWDRVVGRAVARHGLRRPAVVAVSPLVAGFAALRWAGPVTYYGTDDWAAWDRERRFRAAYLEAYRRIAARGHAVAGVSREVADRIGPRGPALVLPNAIEAAEWRAPGPPPPWLEALPRPRAVYVGTLDGRLDRDALRAARDGLGDGTVVLVGLREDAAHLAPVRELPRVHVHGAVEREELAAVVAACDVGLLPHVRNPLTEAMSPLKVFEYLAAGLPVVATDLPPVRALAEPRIALAEPAGFAEAVRAAVALGRAPEADRQAYIDANAWPARHEALLDFVLRDP